MPSCPQRVAFRNTLGVTGQPAERHRASSPLLSPRATGSRGMRRAFMPYVTPRCPQRGARVLRGAAHVVAHNIHGRRLIFHMSRHYTAAAVFSFALSPTPAIRPPSQRVASMSLRLR